MFFFKKAVKEIINREIARKKNRLDSKRTKEFK